MLAAVKGYYDGTQIIMDENERQYFAIGDEVIITILNRANTQKTETRAEKRKQIINSDAYVIPTGRTAKEIDDYLKELRENDRC